MPFMAKQSEILKCPAFQCSFCWSKPCDWRGGSVPKTKQSELSYQKVPVLREQIIHPVKLHQYVKWLLFYICFEEFDRFQFYIGFTADLMQRFEAHNAGKVASTKDRRPLELLYFEGCRSQEDAIHREKYLKTFYGKMFLKNRLNSHLTGQGVTGRFIKGWFFE